MIVGHFGIAYGVRALDTREADARVSLLWLLAAAVGLADPPPASWFGELNETVQ